MPISKSHFLGILRERRDRREQEKRLATHDDVSKEKKRKKLARISMTDEVFMRFLTGEYYIDLDDDIVIERMWIENQYVEAKINIVISGESLKVGYTTPNASIPEFSMDIQTSNSKPISRGQVDVTECPGIMGVRAKTRGEIKIVERLLDLDKNAVDADSDMISMAAQRLIGDIPNISNEVAEMIIRELLEGEERTTHDVV